MAGYGVLINEFSGLVGSKYPLLASASGSSIAISNILNRGTVGFIEDATKSYIPYTTNDQFLKKYPPDEFKVSFEK